MKVLVACEESQEVCKAFRAKDHQAYSCDILPCSGGHPEWHIKNKIENVLLNDHHLLENGDLIWNSTGWDLLIAHPPCTYLANSGVCHLYNKDKTINQERWQKMKEGAAFFHMLYFSDVTRHIPKICIENPIMHIHAKTEIGIAFCQDIYPMKQVIQPWMFGHPEKKATCLWLVNLSPLKETENVFKEMSKLPKNKQQRINYMPPSADRQYIRSKTYPGIAAAMADQWG